jgi:hypothetical protein
MALNLNPNCKRQLSDKLSKALEETTVSSGTFLSTKLIGDLIALERTLPGDAKFREKIYNFVDEYALFEFVFSELRRKIFKTEVYDKDAVTRSLTSLPEFSDIKQEAQKLVESFDTLPWQYKISIELPPIAQKAFKNCGDRYQVYDGMAILNADEDLINNFSVVNSGLDGVTSGLLGLLSEKFKWKKDRRYLQIEVGGFIPDFGETSPVTHWKNSLKAFLGLMSAMLVFKIGPANSLAIPLQYWSATHNIEGVVWTERRQDQIEDDTAAIMNRLDLFDSENNDEEKADIAYGALIRISKALSNKEKSRRILLASQWLFESYAGKNELLAFVQAMVVLEILLGDEVPSDEIGLGQLLRNRCAFLIGKTHQQRSKFLDDFSKIYRVRSQIVHRGKTRLTGGERMLFLQLQWMCQRVIQEEIGLLAAEAPSRH